MTEDADRFDQWLNSGDHKDARYWHNRILSSSAIKITCEMMTGILRDAEQKASNVPEELIDIVAPVQALLNKVCSASLQHAAE